jgi:hypothetical protein
VENRWPRLCHVDKICSGICCWFHLLIQRLPSERCFQLSKATFQERRSVTWLGFTCSFEMFLFQLFLVS